MPQPEQGETTVAFTCAQCGTVEEVTSIRGDYFGSVADFCSTCGAARGDDDEIVAVRPATGDVVRGPYRWAFNAP